MSNAIRVACGVIVLSAALAPILLHSTPAQAQERQGCFMIDDVGRFIDLSPICPAAVPVATAGEPTLGTGDIQATLRWNTPDDLDLAVIDPSNNTVAFYNSSVPSGGQLDVDANAGCSANPSQRPVENVFWPPSRAPQGQYRIEVNLYTRCSGGASGPVSFTLTLLTQGRTQTLTGTVDDQNPTAAFPFSIPARGSEPAASR